jgi:hypothetical protein
VTELSDVYERPIEAATGEEVMAARKKQNPDPGLDISKTFIVTVTLMVPVDADEHLRDARAIEDECRSWLESLRATVHTIRVQEIKR